MQHGAGVSECGASKTLARSHCQRPPGPLDIANQIHESYAHPSDVNHIHNITEEERSGGGSPLPFLGRIQESFGRHHIAEGILWEFPLFLNNLRDVVWRRTAVDAINAPPAPWLGFVIEPVVDAEADVTPSEE